MNSVNVAAVNLNSVAIGSTGVKSIGLPGKRQEAAFVPKLHEALVDAWTFSGYSNDNPPVGIRGVKGNVLTPYNFAWSGSSGFGKYLTDFIDRTTWAYNVSSILITTTKSFTYCGITAIEWIVFSNTLVAKKDIPPLRIRVSGLLKGQAINYYYYANGVRENYTVVKDGEWILPADMRTTKPTDSNTSGFNFTNKLVDNKITVTLLSEHGGSLCLDGVDDYLKLDKTEYALGAIIIGLDGSTPVANQWNYILDCSSYRTYIAYENQVLKAGNNGESLHEENNVIVSDYMVRAIKTPIYIGCKDTGVEFLQMNIRYIGVYENTLTPEEIEEEKLKLEQLWLSKIKVDIPEPEADFNFAKLPSGVNDLMDETGKHSLKLYNFAHSGMSGKDGYKENFLSWNKTNPNSETRIEDLTSNSFTVKEVHIDNYAIGVYKSSVVGGKIQFTVLVAGIPENVNMTFGNSMSALYPIKNGLNTISHTVSSNGNFAFRLPTGKYNITIEQIPLYPDALVFDGIDDYCQVDDSIINTPIKTLVMDFVPLGLGGIVYDQREPLNSGKFALYNSEENNEVAYNARNVNGVTYINGALNKTIMASYLSKKRVVATLVNNDVTMIKPCLIGRSFNGYYHQQMALYRILLFPQALTDLQVKKVMYKYKLTKFDKL